MPDLNTILSFLIIAGQIAMFFFFNQQIKSKNRVIQDFEKLMDTTDIKRLAEFYKNVDELREKSIIAQTNIGLTAWYQEHYAQWGNKFDEVASFAYSILEAMPAAQREEYITTTFPRCKEMFLKLFQDGSNNKVNGFFDSIQNQQAPSQQG